MGAQHGTFYIAETGDERRRPEAAGRLRLRRARTTRPTQFRFGQGLVGQCAREKQRILVTDVPEDYVKISSSLGDGTPLSIVVLPVLFEGEVKAVIELASFQQLQRRPPGVPRSAHARASASCSTRSRRRCGPSSCCKQSQALAEELQKTNAELEEKAQLLAEQKTEVETKNREVEQAKEALEEKAEQLVAHLQVQERVPGEHDATNCARRSTTC